MHILLWTHLLQCLYLTEVVLVNDALTSIPDRIPVLSTLEKSQPLAEVNLDHVCISDHHGNVSVGFYLLVQNTFFCILLCTLVLLFFVLIVSRFLKPIIFPSYNIHRHTYTIGHDNPSVRIMTWLVTPLMLWRETYSLKSIPNDRFYEKLFVAILFTLRVFAKNLLREGGEEIFFSYFVLMEMSDLGSEPRPHIS